MRLKKNFLLFVLSCIVFLNGFYTPFKLTVGASDLVIYKGKVDHLFTHCLIAYPEIAFKNNNYMQYDYDRDCITTLEFERILNSLYINNFCLVKISEIFDIKNGRAHKKPLFLPRGKKPLVFSFDDVNYDTRKLGYGMVDKIIVDEDGRLASYTKNAPDNKPVSYNKEFINIMDSFITNHPDFSHNNARGLICLTGYDGILGYRTDLVGRNRIREIDAVKPVIKALKERGWEFASHSYGHYHMSKISDAKFKSEVDRFKAEVNSLIGKTNVYVYPYGESQITDKKGKKIYKHKLLEEAGFKVFCGVGAKYFYGYAPFNADKKNSVLFMDRKPIDGNNLRREHKEYEQFFNSYEIYDHHNRMTPFKTEKAAI
jgi:peptidoglycan/xylan/chitin deacetylase (PgdA/CDA1 family)